MRYPDPEPTPGAEAGVCGGDDDDDAGVEVDASKAPTGVDAATIIVTTGSRWACIVERNASYHPHQTKNPAAAMAGIHDIRATRTFGWFQQN